MQVELRNVIHHYLRAGAGKLRMSALCLIHSHSYATSAANNLTPNRLTAIVANLRGSQHNGVEKREESKTRINGHTKYQRIVMFVMRAWEN